MTGRLLYLMIIGVLLFTVDGLGQNTWVKTFGGQSSGGDWGQSITTTSDGGFVLTGTTYSNDGDFIGMNKGKSDIFVIKLNQNGDTVWKRTYGGSSDDYGFSITPTSDGGFVLTGTTYSNDGDFIGVNKGVSNIFVIKLYQNGDIVWKKTFGGSSIEDGVSITTTSDGGYVLTGVTSSNDGDFSGMNRYWDIFVLKLDSSGDIVWKKTFGGSNLEIGISITTTTDSGYVLTGWTTSNDGDFSGMKIGNNDIFVMKLNSNGDIFWKKVFGGSSFEYGYSITSTTDGGYVLTGLTTSNDGDFSGMNKGYDDIFVIKLDSNGDIVWKRTFGGSYWESGRSITTTSDGGFVLTGTTYSKDGDFIGVNKGVSNIFFIKLYQNGDIVWKKTFGGSYIEEGVSITTTSDGGYVLTGYTSSTDGDFNVKNQDTSDIFVMKLDSNGNLNNTTSINEFSEITTTLSVHPNPFSNSTTISYKVETPSNVRIELLNTLGQTIEVLREDHTDIGTYQIPLNVSTLSSGMYSVRLRCGSMNEVVPVWVVK